MRQAERAHGVVRKLGGFAGPGGAGAGDEGQGFSYFSW